MSRQPLRSAAHQPDRDDDADKREEAEHDQTPAKPFGRTIALRARWSRASSSSMSSTCCCPRAALVVVITAVLGAFELQIDTVPTVGMAAVAGLKYASIAGLAAGLLGGMATAVTARGSRHVTRKTCWAIRGM